MDDCPAHWNAIASPWFDITQVTRALWGTRNPGCISAALLHGLRHSMSLPGGGFRHIGDAALYYRFIASAFSPFLPIGRPSVSPSA